MYGQTQKLLPSPPHLWNSPCELNILLHIPVCTQDQSLHLSSDGLPAELDIDLSLMDQFEIWMPASSTEQCVCCKAASTACQVII